MKGKRHQEKDVGKNTRRLRVVEIRYVRTPDADERLSRAIDILLCSVVRGTAKSEGSIDAKKKHTLSNAPAPSK